MLYNPSTPQTEGDCGCHGSSHMPQCQLYQPFIGLEENGKPPRIDYYMRAHTCFESYSRIPIKVTAAQVKPELLDKTLVLVHIVNTVLSKTDIQTCFWDTIVGFNPQYQLIFNANLLNSSNVLTIEWMTGVTIQGIIDKFNNELASTPQVPNTTTAPPRLATIDEIIPAVYALIAANGGTVNLGSGHSPATAQIAAEICQLLQKLAHRLKFTPFDAPTIVSDFAGNLSVEYTRLGDNPKLVHIGEKSIQPHLIMTERYRTCVYDGKYGMSRIVKTISLLPGEETTATIKTYSSTTESRQKAENILDSFTESSAQSFQKYLTNDDIQHDTDTTNSKNKAEAKINLTIPIESMPIGVKAGYEGEWSVGTIRDHTISKLDQTTTKHSSESTRNRKIEINTTTNSTYTSGSEDLVVRNLKNINKSRVLNFVYRQLYQEFITMTYLYDVDFEFSLGTPDTVRNISLAELPSFLKKICINAATADAIFGGIMLELCNVKNYQGVYMPLVECKTHINKPCCDHWKMQDVSYQYAQIRDNLSDGYKDDLGAVEVEGIILSVKKYVLPTDDLICDALLGAGEALDCYNIRLQQAAVTKVDLENEAKCLENEKTKQAISVLNMIEDPKVKAELYKKVFGTCCDVPQVGCSCHTCKDAVIETK